MFVPKELGGFSSFFPWDLSAFNLRAMKSSSEWGNHHLASECQSARRSEAMSKQGVALLRWFSEESHFLDQSASDSLCFCGLSLDLCTYCRPHSSVWQEFLKGGKEYVCVNCAKDSLHVLRDLSNIVLVKCDSNKYPFFLADTIRPPGIWNPQNKSGFSSGDYKSVICQITYA